ncbi:MAG: shikimate dehydrogenase [Rubritepida sp.]|nr:shikimate dehydrogenase [Rubritepida sp.]
MITGKARVAGVFGWPAGHSRSPHLHNHWLARYGIDGAYVPLPVPPGQFEAALRGVMAAGFRGANVTIPHKEAAFALCDERDAFATRAGAVNTLVFEAGRIIGSNTDGFGFMANLAAHAPHWRPGPVVLLGAGGAARAIAVALIEAGVPELVVVNRNAERAEALVAALAAALQAPLHAPLHAPLAAALPATLPATLGVVLRTAAAPPLAGATLLVNTTSLGMAGQPPLEIDLSPLAPHAVVADAVYVPRETALLAAARARGLTVVPGLGMLLHQARPGFRLWFGVDPVVDQALHDAVAAGLPCS